MCPYLQNMGNAFSQLVIKLAPRSLLLITIYLKQTLTTNKLHWKVQEKVCVLSLEETAKDIFSSKLSMEIDTSKRVSSVSERDEVLPGGWLDKRRWKGRKRHKGVSIAKNLTRILELYFDLIYFIFILYHILNILRVSVTRNAILKR